MEWTAVAVEWLTSRNSEITAAGNAIWGGVALFTVFLCHGLLRWSSFRRFLGIHAELTPLTSRVLSWARLPAICTAAHRTYWNLAIFLRLDGPYAPVMLEWKHITLLFVLGMAFGVYQVMAALAHSLTRSKLAAILLIWLSTALVFTLLLAARSTRAVMSAFV